jgi:putative sigma-54 modulation protein
MGNRSGGWSVKTNIKARNVELSDKLRADIERKLRRLNRVTNDDAVVTVELTGNASRATDGSHVAQVTLDGANGMVIRSTGSGPNPVAALDRLLDKLERQVVRAKEKPRDSRLRDADVPQQILAREGEGTTEPLTATGPVIGQGAGASAAGDGEGEPEGASASIVKVKRFDMVPMFDEDAITRMEELGHQFFIFLNAETDAVNVLYRRRDGNYGLIEPSVKR